MPAVSRNLRSDHGAVGNGVTDDTLAFMSFNSWAITWQATHTGLIELVMDSGFTFLLGSGPNSWTAGIKQLLVTATGATLTTGPDFGFRVGGQAFQEDDTKQALFATAIAGVSTITLVTAAENSRFSVNQWICLGGGDTQGSGYPPNPFVFEYLQISAINAGTGVITFTTPLVHSYKSTWPSTSGQPKLGGPATIFSLLPEWDGEVEIVGLTMTTDWLPNVTGRWLKLTNVVANKTGVTNGYLAPSATKTCIFDNLTCNGSLEVDKNITTLTIIGGSYTNIIFQSGASPENMTATGAAITYLNGVPYNSVFTGCAFDTNMTLGCVSYGVVNRAQFNTCTASAGCSIIACSPIAYNVTTNFTMTGGVIRIPKASGMFNWVVPGATYVFGRYSGGFHFEGVPFSITDYTEDATYVYVSTSLTGGFPTLPTDGTNGLSIFAIPIPSVAFSGCTGHPTLVDLSQAGAQSRPLFSYTKRVFDTATLLANTTVPIFGTNRSIKVNVTKAYTGIHTPLTMLLFTPAILAGGTTTTNLLPSINLGVLGERIILPGSVSGAQSGDTISAINAWIELQYSVSISSDISAEAPSVWPSVSVEMIASQGVNDPLVIISFGLRLHA